MNAYGYWLLLLLLAAAFGGLLFSRRKSKSDDTAMGVYIQGLRSIISGDGQTAFIRLKQAVDKDTENVDAYLKLGDLFREKGKADKALQIHRELTLRRGLTVEMREEIDRSIVLDFIKADLIPNAIAALRPMAKNGDNRAWAEDRLLELFINGEYWKEAEDLYRSIMKKRGIKENPIMGNIKIMIGRDLHENKEYHKARIAYKEAIALDKVNPLPYLYIAESYMRENRVEDGLEFLKKLCEEIPKYAYLGFAMIEETLFNLGKFSDVEDLYRGVLNKDPGNIPTTIALAGILEKKGEIPAAESLLRSVIDSNAASPAAAIKLATMLADSGRSREGLEILSNAAGQADLTYDVFECRKCGERVRQPEPSCPKCGAIGVFI